MKFVSSDASRIIATFSADDIRPEGGIIPGDFINAVKDRYRFLVLPNLDQLNRDNYRNFTFRGGGLITGRRNVEVVEFTLLDGAVIVDTRDSDDGELVLDDLFAWATSTFGLRPLREPPKRNFLSSVVVELDENVISRMDAFREIAALLTREFQSHYGNNFSYSYSRLAFACDPSILPAGTLRTEFAIERRAGAPYGTNRFYCQSPFRTRTTVEVLERVEALLVRG